MVNGKSQTIGVDCYESFCPVVKPTTVYTVLSLVVSRLWPIKQLDVKNTFLHGDLNETVYMHQPSGFIDPVRPNHVCRLKHSLFSLKQSLRAWYTRLSTFILAHGFNNICDTSLFVYLHEEHTTYFLLYVDDIILTASDPTILQSLVSKISLEFSMTDLGELHHFLRILVTRDKSGLFLNQSQFA